MSDRITKTGKTVLSVFLSATTAVWLTGSAFLVPATAHAQSTDITTLINLLVSLGIIPADKAAAALAAAGSTPAPAPAGKCTFTRGLTVGVTGEDVKCLQKYLNGAGFTVATTGAGSAGSESTYFGAKTQAAVAKWQAANGVAPAAGYFGSISQAKYNALVAGGTTPPPGGGTPPPVVAGTGLTVSASSEQPVASLAPQGAINVKFTKVRFTASSDGDVKVDSIVVERTGLLSDAVFSGIILLDENGDRIGTSKTLNSDHEATLTTGFTVKAGQTRELTVAGDMAADLSSYTNQEGYLALKAVNSAAKVNGTLPIVGAKHRTTASLSMGSVTLATGSTDPGADRSKEVGTKSYVFSSIKASAGTNENILWKSIRFNQSGSATKNDVTNVVVKDQDGKIYPTTVSDDGKYYLANFGAGVTIKKGESFEVSLQGDVVDGSGRTIAFDLYKLEDARFMGVDTKYDLRATDDGAGSFAGTTDPQFDASVVTVSAGSLRAEKATTVAAGDVLIGGTGVTLGGFTFEARGEPVTFAQWVLTITTTNSDSGGESATIENITVYDASGKAVAGPTNPASNPRGVTLTDSITVPTGISTYTVKGNLSSTGWENNDTITLSFTPSTALTSVTGDLTNNTIVPSPATSVSANTMTVKAGSLTVAPATTLSSQTIIRGGTGVELGRFTLNASGSGDDLKVTSIKIRKTVLTASGDTVQSLVLKDGTTTLTTGQNVVNPSGNLETLTFTLDNPWIISKNTSKTLNLIGNISATASSGGTYKFDFTNLTDGDWGVATNDKNTAITEDLDTSTAGATITVGVSGGYAVTVDPSAPTEKWYAAGTTGAIVNVLRFTGTTEELAITDLRLQLNKQGSSTASDVAAVELWDGSTLVQRSVGPAFSSGVQDFTFPTSGTGSFIVPKNSYKKLTIKVDFANIGSDQSGVSGQMVALNYDGASYKTYNKARGSQSSATVYSSTEADTNQAGMLYFRSVPTVTKLAIPSSTLQSGSNVLYKFSVKADPAYDIAFNRVTFRVATSGVTTFRTTLPGFALYDVTSGANKQISNATGAAAAFFDQNINYDASHNLIVRILANHSNLGSATWETVTANETKTYELRATVATDNTGDSVTTTMLEDDARPVNVVLTGSSKNLMDTRNNIDIEQGNDFGAWANAATSTNFIWTDFYNDASTATSLTSDNWMNGFKVPGMSGLETSSVPLNSTN